MCRRIECADCKKPTYAGCGAHVEQVLGDVPRERRCDCRETRSAKKEEGSALEPSLFRRLFGQY